MCSRALQLRQLDRGANFDFRQHAGERRFDVVRPPFGHEPGETRQLATIEAAEEERVAQPVELVQQIVATAPRPGPVRGDAGHLLERECESTAAVGLAPPTAAASGASAGSVNVAPPAVDPRPFTRAVVVGRSPLGPLIFMVLPSLPPAARGAERP